MWLLLYGEASGDSGAVRAQEMSGPFAITVFTAPEPLHAGRVDVSVLVQDRDRGEPILDANVSVQLTPPVAAGVSRPAIASAATHAEAINKLLFAVVADLPIPGTWRLRVGVQQGTESAAVETDLPVAPGVPGLRVAWPYLLIPPAAILLFVLHQSLARRQRLPPSGAAHGESETAKGTRKHIANSGNGMASSRGKNSKSNESTAANTGLL